MCSGATGYEGASLSDLTEAMGINPPSLYAAFGNKEELFCKALDRYVERHDEFLREVLARPKARDAIAALLTGSADSLTDKSSPRAACSCKASPAQAIMPNASGMSSVSAVPPMRS
jgi:AcrR family transcriptional regulator